MLKGVLVFILIALIGIVAYLTYFTAVNFYATPENFSASIAGTENFNFVEGVSQFYPHMRFKSSSISYYFGSECSKDKVDNMLLAFEYIKNKTGVLDFYENNLGEIEIRCGEQYEKEGMLVAGEGGPGTFLNGTLFSVITEGQIILLKDSCSYNVELHELMHVLGFGHSKDSGSIMYPIGYCNQVLSSDYIDELINLYSVPSLPDSYFSEISGTKKGMYLNLNFTVKNQGLADAENVSVYLEKDNKTLDTFSLGDIDIGSGKIFSVENLRISSGTKQIRMVIKDGREIYDSNNFADLILQEKD